MHAGPGLGTGKAYFFSSERERFTRFYSDVPGATAVLSAQLSAHGESGVMFSTGFDGRLD